MVCVMYLCTTFSELWFTQISLRQSDKTTAITAARTRAAAERSFMCIQRITTAVKPSIPLLIGTGPTVCVALRGRTNGARDMLDRLLGFHLLSFIHTAIYRERIGFIHAVNVRSQVVCVCVCVCVCVPG